MTRYGVTFEEDSFLDGFVLKWYSKTVPTDTSLPVTCDVNVSFKFRGRMDLRRKCFTTLPEANKEKRRIWMPWLSGKSEVTSPTGLESSVVYGDNNTRERCYRSVHNLQWDVTYFQNSGTLVVSLPLYRIFQLLSLPGSEANSWTLDLRKGVRYVTLYGVSGQTIPVVHVNS